MHFTKYMFALALGSVGFTGAMSAHALALSYGDILNITAGVPTFDSYGSYTGVRSGSWFAMDVDDNSRIGGFEQVALSQGTMGLVIGMTTFAGASHAGGTLPGDTNVITAPWLFFGNTGSDYLTVPVTGDTTTGLNMSGWTVTWNDIPAIPMGSGAWTPLNAGAAGMAEGPYTNGIGNFIGQIYYDQNDSYSMPSFVYTLDYTATVPVGHASGFGGVKYALHLTYAVPEASTYGMMLAGLGLVGVASARRRKQSKVNDRNWG